MDRRQFIKLSLAGMGLVALSPLCKAGKVFAAESFEKLALTKAEWRKRLTATQYYILRMEGTEFAYSSDLLHEKREGIFACAGCDLPLFPSKYKYDSGTGWPSFYDAIPGHLETKADSSFGFSRTEYHCARCGGHQGHVFKDGPPPTGLRYCDNGVALKFIPKKA